MDVDRADLTRAVAALRGAKPPRDLRWTAEPIDPHLRLHSITEGVVRLAGVADGEPFSLVVKAIRLEEDDGGLWTGGADPSHRNYWKREWLAYATGLLAGLPGRLRAPRCLLATEPSTDRAQLWLEDVAGRPGTEWQRDDYHRAGRDLGTTQGALTLGTVPDAGWLAHRWLRGWVDASRPYAELCADLAAWHDDRLAPLRPLLVRITTLWAEREALLSIAEAAPPTLVHCDFWPTNLVAGADGRTVALDWSQIGVGTLAQDLDQLTLDPVWMQVRPDDDLDALEASVVPAYAEGLRAAGLDLADDDLDRWYAAAAALHYAWFAGAMAELVIQPDRLRQREERFGRSFSALTADRARVVERAVTLGERALARR